MKSRFLKIKRAATWQSTRKGFKKIKMANTWDSTRSGFKISKWRPRGTQQEADLKNQNGEHMGLHEKRI